MVIVKQLGLQWALRTSGGGKKERRYLDYTIDGKPLHDSPFIGDTISGLGWLPSDAEIAFIERLLLKRPNEFGNHTLLYICPECGDINCGALAATVSKTGDYFVWSDFRYVNGYDESMSQIYSEIEPIYFDQMQYWQTFNQRLSALQSDA